MQAPAAASRPASFETHRFAMLLRMRSGRGFRREDEGLFISITSRVGPSGKTGTSLHPGRCISSNDTKERTMLKPLIAATAALLVATSAFAQSDKMKSSDSSEYSSAKKMQKTSEQKMKKSKASTAKGAPESAPGTTTGSAAKKY
jgi:hypothetical protein